MNVLLWVLQVLLALAVLAVGVPKATQPIESLAATMAWAADVPLELVRFIGVAEVLGAIGLIVPPLVGIRRELTPIAAAGLAVIQLLAVLFHLTRGEVYVLPMNLVIPALALAIVVGRRGYLSDARRRIQAT